jgi:acyl-CoA synthetase (NDP forming)
VRPALEAMLRARSIALVGASARPGSFGARMVTEVARSTGARRLHLVNPRYDEIAGRRCVPSLKHVDEPLDLVLLAVNDDALEAQLSDAARIGARAAVIFGSAHGVALRESLRSIATAGGMALCGAGCMGFVNVADGLRAIGYLEREPLPTGPITLITHSGSVFSALLRTRRALGYTLAVSSGQELVTTAADYLEYALAETDTGLVALVLEAIRDAPRLVAGLRQAAARGIPVVLLPVGGSRLGSTLVTAHSGALAGERASWEALAEGTGALLVADLAELTDTLELLATGRRAPHATGIATVHDSGAERSLVADLAEDLAVPFAPLTTSTLDALRGLLADGMDAANPLDLWGTGADTRRLVGSALSLMAADPNVSAVALAVDLVPEFDGDTSYPDAVLDVAAQSERPVAVLANLASAIDQEAATGLRAAGVPVLEGTRSGLVALRHLLARADPGRPSSDSSVPVDARRRERWMTRLAGTDALDGAESFALLADYGIPVVAVLPATDEAAAVSAAGRLGFPVVLKTDEPGYPHKSDVGGVLAGLDSADAVRAAYRDLAGRLGARVLVSATAAEGPELALGLVRDGQLGPLVLLAAGGLLAEMIAERVLALPPVVPERAERLLDRLRAARLLSGWRGAAELDRTGVVRAIVGLGQLAVELGDVVDAVDVNPVIAGADGALAVDALVLPRR